MKNFIKKCIPLFIVAAYSFLAAGSDDDSSNDFGIILAIVIGVALLLIIIVIISNEKESAKGLEKAKESFGEYTEAIEYERGKYILYDKPNHRILLKKDIMDSKKIKTLQLIERKPQTTVTYKEESVTKTSTGSAIGRGVAGALIAGPAGAIIGGATAKKTTETKTTPEYHTTSGYYAIDVIDVDNNRRARFATSDKSSHDKVKVFLQRIIDSNTLEERHALAKIKEDEHAKLLSSDISQLVIGATLSAIEDILINSARVARTDHDTYKLCTEAIARINNAWHTNFESIIVVLSYGTLNTFVGISKPYIVGSFNNMQLDMKVLADSIKNKYGFPTSYSEDVSYFSLTDDNNRINAYLWRGECGQLRKIDYIFEHGKYKYEYMASSVNETTSQEITE